MGWNSPGDSSRTRPLVLRFSRLDGSKRTVSFPGGVDKTIVHILEHLLVRVDALYQLKEGECWGYNFRDIAGTTVLSYHGRGGGRAIDINASENGRGTAGKVPPGAVAILKSHGFTWGGDWSYTDPMHFEADRSRLFYWNLWRKMKRQAKKGAA